MPSDYLIDLRQKDLPASLGNKANNLARLQRKGYPIPVTHVCSWEAYLRYRQDDGEIVDRLQAELSRKLDLQLPYAVRSSANFEDQGQQSFAGQFKSVLDVQGLPALLQAIWSIWATTLSESVQTYLKRHALEPDNLRMAVLIQEMVRPVVSGVAFSRNPITGIDEIVVEAVRGSGVSLMQEGVTPQRWTHRWGQWQAQPERTDIDHTMISQVVEQTRHIAKAFQHPVDMEWVFDGHRIYWVQMREITSARRVRIYSNRIAKEMLPGLIKPLIWSVNVPLVTTCWAHILTELIGPHGIAPESLARAFYYRTYFDMGTLGDIFESLSLPRESLEMLMLDERASMGSMRMSMRPSHRTLAQLPRIAAFVGDKWFFARRLSRELPALEARYRTIPLEPAAQMPEHELLAEIDRLYVLNQRTAYFNIIGPLLLFMYARYLRAQLKKLGMEFANFDLTRGIKELERYNPDVHLRRLHCQFKQLPPDVQARLRSGDAAWLSHLPDQSEFRRSLEVFIRQFGHLSDSGNDFSATPWRETPGLILHMVAHYQPAEENTAARVGFEDLPLRGLPRWWLSVIYRRARQYHLFRERVSSLYTYGYGLFRVYYRALGERLAQRGVLKTWEDIFYLDQHEVRRAATGDADDDGYAARAENRRQEMARVAEVALPSIVYGETPPPVATAAASLRGTATSQGYYRGPARVVRGIQDFPKVGEGDVLVIPYSDVGWTPLFARAGAVIAESGGMLSHSSIIAREYSIPAVVSVCGAQSLRDGMLVSVNGFSGEVTVEEAAEAGGGDS